MGLSSTHNFILINYSIQESNDSYPVRPVSNSSCFHRMGSLNSHLIQGPQAIDNLRTIFQQFLQREFALTADMKRAYRSIHTDPDSNRLRNFFWINDPETKEPFPEIPILVVWQLLRLNYG